MKNPAKIISLATLALMAFSPVARAADDTPPPPPQQGSGGPMKHMREKRVKQLDEALHLTAEQKTQIQAIWDKTEEQGRALRKDKSVPREQRREKMREAMKAAHDQVRALLTPEQQKIFDTLPPEGPRGGPSHDGDQPPPPPPTEKSE